MSMAGQDPDTSTSSAEPDAGAAMCQAGETRCEEGCISTCGDDGAFGPALACTGHRTCTGVPGAARCVCKEAPACTTTGTICVSQTTLASCARDELGCAFETAARVTCASGACLGAPGAATCCAPSCEGTPTRCESGSTLGTCTIGAGGCATFVPSSCAAGTVCERTATPGCVDPEWAEWPMPNSPADVAAGAPNPASLRDNKDGTITDNVTGLMWEQVGHEAATFDLAQAHCQTAARLGGFSDWRVPSIVELMSIADFSRTPSIDTTFFPPGLDGWDWSTTLSRSPLVPGLHLTLNYFRAEMLASQDETSSDAPNVVRCVR
jgi:hypothetical protein